MDPPQGGEGPPRKKHRGESKEAKEKKAEKDISMVKSTLNQTFNEENFHPIFFQHLLVPLLGDAAERCTALRMEAFMFAEFHLVYCHQMQLPFPTLNQTYFRSCLGAVAHSRQGLSAANAIPGFTEARRLFLELYPDNLPRTSNEHLSRLLGRIGVEMETATANHISLNFNQRVIRYAKLRYGLLSKKEAEHFVRMATMTDDHLQLTADQIHFKGFIGDIKPAFVDENYNSANVHELIPKLIVISQFMEEQAAAGVRGARTFTLVPKGSTIPGYIHIENSFLPALLNHLPVDAQREIMVVLRDKFDVGSESYNYLSERLQAGSSLFQDTTFYRDENRPKLLWRVLFNVSKFETQNREFGNEISTDGVGASVLLRKPKNNHAAPVNNDEVDPEFDPPPESYDRFERYLGIDPGRTFLVTGFDNTMQAEKGNCFRISTAEWRHRAKITENMNWQKKFRERNNDYAQANARLPTLKTVNYHNLMNNIRATLAELKTLRQFSRVKGFRSHRFKSAVFRKKALHQLVKKLIGNTDKDKLLVGFGDWSQQKGLKGSEPAPVRTFRRELRKHVTVIRIDEFRTSKTCSECHHRVKKIKHHHHKNQRQESLECHEVVRCSNSECNKYWQRDVNASRNMYTLLCAQRDGLGRPAVFARN